MFGHDDKKDEDKHEGAAVNPVSDSGSDWQHPGPPPADDNSQAGPTEDFTAGHSDEPSDTPAPAADQPDLNPSHELPATDSDHASAPAGSDFNAATTDNTDNGSSDDLIDLKQEALGKLSPLIGHLDQSPEEKFRTLMMMIQASDDQSLIRQAYDTALTIDDEKTRAQALLDIVNEINYFTQNPKAE
ncbi:MAG TPA: hypothetical protein VHC21_00630 [Candidatus Saccharimonadales bacterium]|nr:hypothetical protein [Candidatus Saccharimonadales bacterium]